MVNLENKQPNGRFAGRSAEAEAQAGKESSPPDLEAIQRLAVGQYVHG